MADHQRQIDLTVAEEKRAASREIISDLINKLETCAGSDVNCGCDANFRKIQQLLLEIKEEDKRILQQLDVGDIKDEIKQSTKYNLTMEVKMKQLNEKVTPHLAKLSDRRQTSRISEVRQQWAGSERQEAVVAQTREMDIATNQIVTAQTLVAKTMEKSYIALVANPKMSGKIREAGHKVRGQHFAFLNLMKNSKNTADHIRDSLIPMIIDACYDKDRGIADKTVCLILAEAEGLQEEAESAVEKCELAARHVQECIAQVNQLQDTRKTLDAKIEEETNLVAQVKREHDDMEQRCREMESLFRRDQQLTAERVRAIEGSSKPGIENLCMLTPGLALFGPFGVAAAGLAFAGSVGLMVYKNKKVKKAHSEYMKNIPESLKMLEKEMEMDKEAAKVARELIQTEANRKLNVLERDSIDTESLNQALAPLGAVYSRLTGLQQLWYTVSAMMRRVQLDTKSKRVFTQADTEEHVTKLLKSLGQMDANWECFATACQKYSDGFGGSLEHLYSFLSTTIDQMQEDEIRTRIAELSDHIIHLGEQLREFGM